MHIGIDVGGTNTDAVLMDGVEVLAAIKRPTTSDVMGGICEALVALRQESNFQASQIKAVMLGTTHFTNAVVSMSGLTPTAVVRVALPSGSGIPPMFDWPADLRDTVGNHCYEIKGGHEFDGREISKLDEAQLFEVAQDIAAKKIRAIAITAVFSPTKTEHEIFVHDFLQKQLPDVKISMSHEIGRLGLLERENATIINASLLELAEQTTLSFQQALHESDIDAQLYLSQNDGTLMSVEQARRFPITTFSSGPTNSMRGAALLSGLKDCIVIDIGGTTSDIGILINGFPRQATTYIDIGGVRTNFRMPDLLPMGIGGGSVVDLDTSAVGPKSVGFRLSEKAFIFGGDVLTASDIAVAAGLADIGDKTKVAHLDPLKVKATVARIRERLAAQADQMKTSSEPIAVVLVGGGSILIEGEELPGIGPIIRPPHAGCANAVGAAIAQIGAEIDRMMALEGKDRQAEIKALEEEVKAMVIEGGAVPETVEVVEKDEVAIAYIPNDCVRLRLKAVGDLVFNR